MWLRIDDQTYDNPKIRAVREACRGAVEAAVMMWCYASAQRTNGWVPTGKAREIASPRELKALTTVRGVGKAPMFHQPGDECPCLDDKTWPAEGGLWAHDFLDRNPSRQENDVQRAKARELKDKGLKHAVRQRDGDQCRYCGVTVRWADRKTVRGGVYDHVDPSIAAGADNLVVACRSCNGQKKDCTPAAAGMTLLPPPETVLARQAQINIRSAPDQMPISAGSTDRPQIEPKPDLDPDPDPPPGPAGPTTTSTTPTAMTHAQNQATKPVINSAITSPMTVGTGRGGPATGSAVDRPLRDQVGTAGPAGHRTTIGPATTHRTALVPPPYFKATTANAPPMQDPP